MSLPNPSLAKICLEISKHIEFLGANQNDLGWKIITGAPGVNLSDVNISTNTLNVFYYRFKPAGLNAGAGVGDIHWMKIFCIITAFGFDDNDDKNLAGINELRMISEVVRLFQEQPIKIFEDINDGNWHVQFIPRPLADEQINQIWSTQGSLVYRPSIAYEIALAPIEPETPTAQPVHVTSIGTVVGTNINNRDKSWPDAQPNFLPLSASVDITNPQWAPIIVIIIREEDNSRASLSLNLKIKGIKNIPSIELFIAGDESEDINIVGQLSQTLLNDKKASVWEEITLTKTINADVQKIDLNKLPLTVDTRLEINPQIDPWKGIDPNNDSFKLQLFAERKIVVNNIEVRIRSNPILISITITKEEE